MPGAIACLSCTEGICSLGSTRRPGKCTTADLGSVGDEVRRSIKHRNPHMAKGVHLKSLLLRPDASRPIHKSYQLLEEIGSGAFSRVFRAKCIAADDVRAVKQVPKSGVADLDCLYAELEIMVHLDHPNVARFYEFFEDGDTMHLVTELCLGGDFSELDRRQDSPEEIKFLFRDVFMAVSYCHDLGIVHRDLKFENCMLQKLPNQRRVAKVIDFGLAKVRRADDKVGHWLNEQTGTRFFEAPEVIDLSKTYGVKCDVWSIGVMLYIVLTDEHPCAADASSLSSAEFFRKVLRAPVRTVPMDDAQVPEDAGNLLLKLLVKDAKHRISAQEALREPYLQVKSNRMHLRWSWRTRSSSQHWCEHAHERALNKELCARLRSFQQRTPFEKAILTLVAHNAPPACVEDLRASFMQLDKHCTGTISKEELAAGFAESDLAGEDVDEHFRALSADGSGKIHYTQWLAATLPPSLLTEKRVIKQVYDFFDFGGEGQIGHGALLHVLSSEDLVRSVMEQVDTSGDGKICEEEFKAEFRQIACKMAS